MNSETASVRVANGYEGLGMMREVPDFLKRFKLYHCDVPDILKCIIKKRLLSEHMRALVAKCALLHEFEDDREVSSELKRMSSVTRVERKTAKSGIKVCIGGVTALQIERVDGLRVNVMARRRGEMLCVKVTNVGDRSAKIGKLYAGHSDGVREIALPATTGVKKWLGLWCELEVEVHVKCANEGRCVMFEVC